MKPEYLSLGFFQSVTFSSTAATTCELVRRRPIDEVVFDVVDVGLGGDSLAAAVAAERLVVDATEAIDDADLREEDAMLIMQNKDHRESEKRKRTKGNDAPTKQK